MGYIYFNNNIKPLLVISADTTGQIHVYNSIRKEISSFLAHSNDISRILLMKNNTLINIKSNASKPLNLLEQIKYFSKL